ncbi:AfsR/SARP family transcriptional regulator [Streptomyces sp. NPDC002265]|uniref:AfsR/SARP family transcriptional regulator n=1 Tax=unclassified Streptomyces TaxID=2593676 RepID=UPI00332477E5
MEIRLLGAMTARERCGSFAPTAAKPRQVLALLALQAGQVVPVLSLIEELWGDHPPRSAMTTLQTYVLHLRRGIDRALGRRQTQSAKEILETVHGGYQLNAQPGEVDVHEHEHLMVAGRAAAQAGDDESASRLMGRALQLWRGPALVDVEAGPLLDIELLRLNEARLGAVECRVAAELRLGRHAEVLGELTVLTARYPLHERLHEQLMTALYRAGRVWQALETYQKLRTTLDHELGLEPSERLRRLHQALLNGEERLPVPDDVPAQSRPA